VAAPDGTNSQLSSDSESGALPRAELSPASLTELPVGVLPVHREELLETRRVHSAPVVRDRDGFPARIEVNGDFRLDAWGDVFQAVGNVLPDSSFERAEELGRLK
jgi:hypothetical protein